MSTSRHFISQIHLFNIFILIIVSFESLRENHILAMTDLDSLPADCPLFTERFL